MSVHIYIYLYIFIVCLPPSLNSMCVSTGAAAAAKRGSSIIRLALVEYLLDCSSFFFFFYLGSLSHLGIASLQQSLLLLFSFFSQKNLYIHTMVRPRCEPITVEEYKNQSVNGRKKVGGSLLYQQYKEERDSPFFRPTVCVRPLKEYTHCNIQ